MSVLKQNKSAKDIAFDKERIKFRKEIKNLQYQVMQMDNQIKKLNETIVERENELRQQAEWIDRLLEYMDISKEDLQQIIKNEKEKAKLNDSLSSFLHLSNKFMRSYF